MIVRQCADLERAGWDLHAGNRAEVVEYIFFLSNSNLLRITHSLSIDVEACGLSSMRNIVISVHGVQ